MKTPEIRYHSERAVSTLLVLQQDTAWWVKVSGGSVVQYQAIQMVADEHNDDSGDDQSWAEAQLPVWAKQLDQNVPLSVDLILDTTIDEVDRVGIAKTKSSIINRYRASTTIRRLRRDYPQAKVYPIKSQKDEHVAALIHPVVPDSWCEWLTAVQALHVVFTRVATATMLAARWSRKFPDYVLINIKTGARTRHVVAKQGVAYFSKTMPVVLASSNLDTGGQCIHETDSTMLNQTMAYARTIVPMSNEDILVVEPVVNTSSQAALSLPTDLQCLFALFYSHEVGYRTFDSNLSNRTGPIARIDQINSDEISRLRTRLTSWFNANHIRLNQCLWNVTTDTLRWAPYLLLSFKHLQVKARAKFLRGLSYIVVLAAILSVCLVVIKFAVDHRVQISLKKQTIDITDEAVFQARLLSDLHERPEAAVDTLRLVDVLKKHIDLVTPAFVLESVASAMAQTPSIELVRLTWVLLADSDSFQTYETLGHGLDRVAARQQLNEHPGLQRLQTQVEGVVNEYTLEKQQQVLKGFTALLQTMPTIDGIKILESPLDSALSSKVGGEQAGTYRLLINWTNR